MPGSATSSASGIALAVATPARNGTSGSFSPWITTVGTSSRLRASVREPEARMAASCRAVPAGWWQRSKRGRGLLAEARLVDRVAGGPDHPEDAYEVLDVGVALVRRAPHQHAPHAQLRRAHAPVASRGQHRAERQHPLRPAYGHRLGDHRAHRDADHVRALDAEPVEEAEAVVRHVHEQVRRVDAEARHRAHHVRHGRIDLRGHARVAVVEADHVEAALRDALAELLVPVDELHPEAHHEQERRVGGIADRLVGELDRSDADALLGHRPGRSTLAPETSTENLKLLVRTKLGSFRISSSFAVCPFAKRQPFPNSWNRSLPRWLSLSR